MLDRHYPSHPAATIKQWWFFTILSAMVLTCASCDFSSQQTSPSRGKTVQSLRSTHAGSMPLTDSAPVTPMVSVSPSPSEPPTVLPPATPTNYEAESPQNTLTGDAQVASCSDCSGGYRVIHIGKNGTLQFNNVSKRSAGNYLLTIYYSDDKRTLYISVNGEPGKSFYVASSNGNTVPTFNVTIALNAGANTIKFFNPVDSAPDIDRIIV
jgi:hypothetical protein